MNSSIKFHFFIFHSLIWFTLISSEVYIAGNLSLSSLLHFGGDRYETLTGSLQYFASNISSSLIDVYGLFQLNKVNKPKPENLVAQSLDWSDPPQKSCIRTAFPNKLLVLSKIWTFDQAKGMSTPAKQKQLSAVMNKLIQLISHFSLCFLELFQLLKVFKLFI